MRHCFYWIFVLTLHGVATVPTLAAPVDVDREYKSALQFRKQFAQNAKALYSQDQIQQLIFLPNRTVLDRRMEGQATVEDVLAFHRFKLQTLLPSQLYKEASQTPDPKTKLVVKHPVTIVILPGIFGEFIDHIPYEEIFKNEPGSLAKVWAQLTASADFTDQVFDLDGMQKKDQPMRELVEAGSIDDETGAPQTRIILLKAPKGSLESLGTLAESAAIYQKRLTKIFDRLGQPENAYFLGYSRGLNVGLELVSSTDAKTYPWIKGFRGLIGLGGVTYGSAVADMALDQERAESRVLTRLRQLASDLEVPDEGNAAIWGEIMLRNTGRWAAALGDIANYGRELKSPLGLELENIQSDAIDINFLVKALRDIALNKFQLDRPFSDYAQNIKRFKLFVQEAWEGIESLSTRNCLAWIKAHRLPEHLHYYAITTTMPDPSSQNMGISPLTGNTLAYEPSGLDYRSLRLSYYSYLEMSGMSLNDSQISLDRSPFWPELHQLANPRQKPFRSTLLAVLGTDHWGMAFPVAIETASGKVNPFPRTILMKTLGEYLGSQD